MPLLERLFSIIAPNDCLKCGQEGRLLCNWCLPDACSPLPAQCYRCHSLSQDSRVCQRCRPKTRLSFVWLRTDYEDVAKQLIYELKFGRNRAAASVIAELLQSAVPYLPDNTIITHIPTVTSHVRQRGYDQAQLIAVQFARSTERRHVTLLGRSGQRQQVGSKRAERLVQLRGVFRPLSTSLIKGAHILLVDDVATTGATLEEAARELKRAGARRVDAAVFARTL